MIEAAKSGNNTSRAPTGPATVFRNRTTNAPMAPPVGTCWPITVVTSRLKANNADKAMSRPQKAAAL